MYLFSGNCFNVYRIMSQIFSCPIIVLQFFNFIWDDRNFSGITFAAKLFTIRRNYRTMVEIWHNKIEISKG